MRVADPIPVIIVGACFGKALRIARCTAVIVSRRSAGREARNSGTVGRGFGTGQTCPFFGRQSNPLERADPCVRRLACPVGVGIKSGGYDEISPPPRRRPFNPLYRT